MFLAQRIGVRVATIPAGKDPCDYTLAEGPDAFRKLVADAPDALQYAWTRRQAEWQAAGGNLADRNRAVDEFLRLIVSTSAFSAADEVRRGQLAQHVAHMLNLPATALQQQMRRLARRLRPAATGPAARDPGRWVSDSPTALAERQLLEVLLNRPDLFDLAAERIDPQDFRDPSLRAVAEGIWAMGQDDRLSLDELLATEAMAAWGALLTDLAGEGERRGNSAQTLHDAVSHMLYCKEDGGPTAPTPDPHSDEHLRQFTRRLQAADLRRHPKIR